MWRLPAAIPLLVLLWACGDGGQEDQGATGAPAAASPREQTAPPTAPPDASWVHYRDELEPFLDAPYLEEPLQRRARDTHEALSLLAELHAGRVPPNLLVMAMQLYRQLEGHRHAWERAQAELPAASVDAWRLLLPAYAREALATARQILEDRLGPSPITAKALAGQLQPIEDIPFTIIPEPPGVFCIESNPGWDELAQVRERARTLAKLHRAFQRELSVTTALDDEPLAILVLRRPRTYRQILLGRPGPNEIPARQNAWYDPSRRIIVLLGDAPAQDLFYAGTRALLDRSVIGAHDNPWVRIAWLREGLAAWFAGARRTLDAESGTWAYDFGILDDASLFRTRKDLGAEVHAALELPALLTTTYGEFAESPLSRLWDSRGRWFSQRRWARIGLPEERGHPLLLTGSSVFAIRCLLLVHFLRDFEMDENERVLISPAGEQEVVGRYRSRWNAFLLEALRGRDDIDTFRRTLGLEDPAEFQQFCRLFTRYHHWIAYKAMLGQISAGGLIPYDRHVNRRGDKSGQPEDDFLPAVAPPAPGIGKPTHSTGERNPSRRRGDEIETQERGLEQRTDGSRYFCSAFSSSASR